MDEVQKTLNERGSRYGDFTNHARICQSIKHAMMYERGADPGDMRPNWVNLSDVQKQALETIADKIARILSGDPNYADNWHDIQGYAKLAEDRCRVKEEISDPFFTTEKFWMWVSSSFFERINTNRC